MAETYAEGVLGRALREYQQQEAADPQSADRGLLEEGRAALFRILGRAAPLDRQSIRDGFLLLNHKRDRQSLSALLMRYLAQPLSDSETAWAYLHLVNAIAMGGSAAGSVLAHETFERWIPGKSPLVSVDWPFYPATEETTEAVYSRDEIRLLFLSQATELNPSFRKIWFDHESVEFMTSFLKTWCSRDFLAKADAILSEIPTRPRSRRLRFSVLRKAANTCVSIGDLDDTGRYVQQMHSVAEQAEDEALGAELKAQALGQEIHLAQRRQDEATFAARAAEMTSLLNATARKQGADLGWIRIERQSLAIVLMRGKRHDLALPLWEANAENGGQVGGWGWLLYAATAWQVTCDRERTVALLREACAHEDKELIPRFTERPEFAGVRDDTEFLQALGQQFAVR